MAYERVILVCAVVYKNHPLFLEKEWSANRLPKPHLQWVASLGNFYFTRLQLGACACTSVWLWKRVDFFPIILEFLSKLMLLLLFHNWASHRQSWQVSSSYISHFLSILQFHVAVHLCSVIDHRWHQDVVRTKSGIWASGAYVTDVLTTFWHLL